MGQPYLHKQHCPVCDSRMDPNADNLKSADGESVCSKECRDEMDQKPVPPAMGAAFPMLAEANNMLRNISIGPKP